MKLWKVSYHDPEIGLCYRWVLSKADATRSISELKKLAKDLDCEGELIIHGAVPVNVPTTKVRLCHFLNNNAFTQDGAGQERL